jgi:hypothetical protein
MHSDSSPVRPSGWWYALVPVLFLLGIGYGLVVAVDEGRAVAESFSSFGADGRGSVELEDGDTATVLAFWEDGRSTESIVRPTATVTITDPDGDDVRFDPAGPSRSTFSFGSRSGIELGTFDAATSGTHDVQVTFAQPGPLAAVGRLDWQAIVGSVLRPIGLGAAAAVGLWILLLVLRGMSKRRRRAEPQGASPSGGPFV